MPRPLIAVTDSVFPSLDPAIAALKRVDPELVMAKSATVDDILAVARDADAILVTYAKLPGDMLRQLKRCLGSLEAAPPEWQTFLAMVDEAYAQADEDRALLERSLELTSQDLLERNRELREDIAERKQTLEALRVFGTYEQAMQDYDAYLATITAPARFTTTSSSG